LQLHFGNFMKYIKKNKTLEFKSDEEVTQFHDQLTEIMRAAMMKVGSVEDSEAEALKLTEEFFKRYSVLTDTLCRLRAHLPRGEVV